MGRHICPADRQEEDLRAMRRHTQTPSTSCCCHSSTLAPVCQSVILSALCLLPSAVKMTRGNLKNDADDLPYAALKELYRPVKHLQIFTEEILPPHTPPPPHPRWPHIFILSLTLCHALSPSCFSLAHHNCPLFLSLLLSTL